MTADTHTHVIPLKTVGSFRASDPLLELTHHLLVYVPPTEVEYRRLTARMLRRVLKITKGTPDTEVFRRHTLGFVAYADRRMKLTAHIGSHSIRLPRAKRNTQVKITDRVQPQRLQDDGILSPSFLAGDTDRAVLQLTYETSEGQIYESSTLVMADRGLSIISDIDDTVKVTFVHDRKEMLARTFLQPFDAVEGMAAAYRQIAEQYDATVHYVSSSPWQLYQPLIAFLREQEFPVDSINLRKFTLKDVTLPKKFSPAAKRKRASIEEFLLKFPNRRVILIGDSGEKDPEIYGDIARKFPGQVALIAIRNLKNDSIKSYRYKLAWLQVESARVMLFTEPAELLERLDSLEQPVGKSLGV